MSPRRARLIVVYDKGSAGPYEIHASLSGLAELIFLVPENPHTRAIRPVLAEFGTVVAATGTTEQLASLRGLAPDGIVTFSETLLPLAGEVASALGLPFHSQASLRVLTDKHAQRRRLRERGVDPTRSVLVDSAEQWSDALTEVGLPAVVKPLRGAASRNTHKLDSRESVGRLTAALLDAERQLGIERPCLVFEEYVQGRDSGPYGDYVSVESIVSGGRVTHCAITGKLPLIPPFRESGQFWPSHLVGAEQSAVLNLTTAAINALELDSGITHTELKLTEQGPRIIEVNGRLGGWINELATRTTHIDLIEVAGRIALGQPASCELFHNDRTFFQYYNLAPAVGGVLRSVDGLTGVRRVPGVTRYRQLVRPGSKLEPGVTTYQLDAIIGDSDSPRHMVDTISRALGEISFEFTLPHGRVQISGHELRDCHFREMNDN